MERAFVDLTLGDDDRQDGGSRSEARMKEVPSRFEVVQNTGVSENEHNDSSFIRRIPYFRKRTAEPLYTNDSEGEHLHKRRALGSLSSERSRGFEVPSAEVSIITSRTVHLQRTQWKPENVNTKCRKSRKRKIDLTNEPNHSSSELIIESQTRRIKNVLIKGLSFQPNGITVEVGMDLALNDDSFLRIEDITRARSRILFWGRRLFRPNAFDDKKFPKIIPHTRNELVWVPQKTSAVILNRIIGVSKFTFTNERCNWRNSSVRTCRLKVNYIFRGSTYSEPVKNANWVVRYLTAEESDYGKGFTNEQLREKWRGRTSPFGEGKLTSPIESSPSARDETPEIIDLDNVLPNTTANPATRSGGASCGARQAGLQIKWAVDMNPNAIKTYRLNFDLKVKSRCMDAFNFFQNSTEPLRVDIMHASPPCQTYSPAHTVPSEENDDRNSACLHGIRNAIEKVRPRILTMEETFGLDHQIHRPSLYRVVMDLIELGYSPRWEIIKLSGYGVPQTRKRLILVAVGPGETLFNFPPASYGGLGQPQLRTIRDAISAIPDDAPDHDAKTITTGGGDYHPSGMRTLTDREVACLQTFPRDFRFYKSGARRQIGNAFPPMAAMAIYKEAKKSLRETDEREQRLARN
ncbi:uncharacterized protein N7469_000485 [Penicillium citrinum]|uniref:DNA (cytosine-5-)-methyltransferase n=1 Tax=Penicillium citrinum TaxID=5077 RepID=A0A9W9PFU3_PENCI|nr:uncharacterized protein N7469_000485 [Penicillium citrinum]KAJ5242158.1 hypothetical protein N7469_000485 [Penicillium citrinum]